MIVTGKYVIFAKNSEQKLISPVKMIEKCSLSNKDYEPIDIDKEDAKC